MATFTHSKNTYISVATFDLSAYTSESEFSREADVHDVSCYGADWKAHQGGLLSATFTMKGVYDSTTSGPHDKIISLIGTSVAIVRRVEGTGSGKPETTCSAIMKSYVESSPVNDMVKWSADFDVTGTVTEANQS